MTIKELIKMLQKYPKDFKVLKSAKDEQGNYFIFVEDSRLAFIEEEVKKYYPEPKFKDESDRELTVENSNCIVLF